MGEMLSFSAEVYVDLILSPKYEIQTLFLNSSEKKIFNKEKITYLE